MPGNGTTRLIQYGTAAVVVLATALTLFQVTGQVSALQVRVRELEAATATLDEVEARIDRLQAHAAALERFRDDILAAVCAANARTRGDLRQCARVAGGGSPPSPVSGPLRDGGRG